MSGYLLDRELHKTAQRFRWLRFWTSLTICWLTLFGLGAALLWLPAAIVALSPSILTASAGVAAAAAVVASAALAWRTARNARRLAQQIETRYPDLDARLMTVVDTDNAVSRGTPGYLRQTLVAETLRHARSNSWREVVPSSRLKLVQVVHAASLAGAVMVWGAYSLGARIGDSQLGDIAALADARQEVQIEPGDARIERGTSLLVLARFGQSLPADVVLEWRERPDADPATARELADGPLRAPMQKSLDDPVYAARIPAVREHLSYAVRYGSAQTREYRITVFDYPELLRADVRLAFPSYAGMPDALVEDTRSITAVEGTRLEWILQLNKPVAAAHWKSSSPGSSAVSASDRSTAERHAAATPNAAERAATIELAADPDDPTVRRGSLTISETRRLGLELVDDDGRGNQTSVEFTVHVLPNRSPAIKLIAPARDVQVSPVEELSTRAEIVDDFGVLRYGFMFSLAGEAPREVVLGEAVGGKERRLAEHLLDLEALGAEPDQLASYHFWAEDYDAQGAVRRKSSDLYFAEVRRFEEIFRQGQQPAGGESPAGQAGQAAEQLAELQKQIISATWTLLQREPVRTADELAADAATVRDSQEAAREQAAELGQELADPRSKARLDAALEQMQRALDHLGQAVADRAAAPLDPALAAEQAAYQSLLKLRANEHQVVRGNRQQSPGGQGGSRSQQQLEELDLADAENRYETQRSAASASPSQQREARQALNRLRELAQRQQDLNQQLKQLQTALQAARDDQQREEIQRRLRRLRDQQQDILRDTDELRDRLDQNPSSDRMAESREQLESTRSHVRRASEALEQGLVSQAAAAGERARDALSQLRDQFRRDTANQFGETMEQMRREARQLDEQQQRIARELDRDEASPRPSLRPADDRQRVAEGLREQKQGLERLLNEMRQTVEQAETSEALLAKQLYDAARDAQQRRPERSLEAASQLLERGFPDQARLAEQDAGRTISGLRAGVERAAESVLGDESEALRRASQELDRLSRELDREIASAEQKRPTGSAADAAAGSEPRQGTAESAAPGEPSAAGAESEREPPRGRGPSSAGDPSASPQRAGEADSGGAGQTNSGDRRTDGQNQRRQLRGGESRQAGSADAAEPATGNRAADSRSIGPGGAELGPLTGPGFRDWSDRLRDVEEMVGDPQLRAEAARIRDRAAAARAEFKRHSQEPNWDLVRETIGKPLAELQRIVAYERLRREHDDALVPVDREPVPTEYVERVRKYYERLGAGE